MKNIIICVIGTMLVSIGAAMIRDYGLISVIPGIMGGFLIGLTIDTKEDDEKPG